MSNAQNFNIEIDEESDYSVSFYKTNPSTGLPVNLTGYKAEAQVRRFYEGSYNPIVLLAYSTDSGEGITIDYVNGKVTLVIPRVDTTVKDWSTATYDLFLVDPSGLRSKLVKGLFTILSSVTKTGNTTLA